MQLDVNKRKNILVITSFPPCSKTAGQAYTKRVIEELINLQYKVSLIYFQYPGHTIEVPKDIKILKVEKPAWGNCLRSLKYHPFFTKRFDKGLCEYINQISKKFDLVYFDFSQVILYSLFIDHPAKWIMCHDVVYQRYLRRKIPFNVYWIKKTESKILGHEDKIFTFSKKDCRLLHKSYGVKSQPVNFYLKTDKSYQYEGITLNDNTFCFYGAWNRKENIESLLWFIDNVLNFTDSGLRYIVIGGGMDVRTKSRVEKNIRFRVIGFVDDPLNEIAKCQALIAPLGKGAGVKMKVVDALSTGTPVIGTEIAFEGIEDNTHTNLLKLAATPSEYIKILNSWSPVPKEKKEQAADEFFKRYDTNHIVERISKILN